MSADADAGPLLVGPQPESEPEQAESVSTPLPSPKRAEGPRPPEASPERWMALLKTDRAPRISSPTQELVGTLKRQLYEVGTSTNPTASPDKYQQERRAFTDAKNKALEKIEQLGGTEALKFLDTESTKLAQGYAELQRLQRQASMKEARLLAEIAEKEQKWEQTVKEMLEQYAELESVSDDRLQRKELMHARNKALEEELADVTAKKEHFEASLKAFVGRKASCAVCAYVKHHEGILIGYETRNEELQGRVEALESYSNTQSDELREMRKKNETMETKYKAMEHSCRHFRKKLEILDADLKQVEGFKRKIADLEKELVLERKRFLQYSDEVEPQLEQFEALKPKHAGLEASHARALEDIAGLEREKSDLMQEREQLRGDLGATRSQLAETEESLRKTVERLQQAKQTLLRNVLKGWIVNDDPWELPRLIVQVWRDHLPDLKEDNRIWRLERDHAKLNDDHAQLTETHNLEMAAYAELRANHEYLQTAHSELTTLQNETARELQNEREHCETLKASSAKANKERDDFQFRLNQTCDQLEETEKQLQDLNVVFAQRINKITELEDAVLKLRAENDRLWERQGITVCDKHFLKPKLPKALEKAGVKVGEFAVEGGGGDALCEEADP
eukprot:g12616.t1